MQCKRRFNKTLLWMKQGTKKQHGAAHSQLQGVKKQPAPGAPPSTLPCCGACLEPLNSQAAGAGAGAESAEHPPQHLSPCGHVVCASCCVAARLSDLSRAPACCVPGCKRVVTATSPATAFATFACQDLVGMPVNTGAAAAAAGGGPSDRELCFDCVRDDEDDPGVASHKCTNCKGGPRELCRSHAMAHSDRSHTVTVLEGAPVEQSLCASHPSGMTRYYCAKDNCLVCVECTLPGQPHEGHTIKPVELAAADLSSRLAPVLAECTAGIAAHIAAATALAQEHVLVDVRTADAMHHYSQQVEAAIAAYASAMRSRRDRVQAEVSAAHERVVKSIDVAEGVYRVGAGQLTAGVAMGEAAQRNRNPVAMTLALTILTGMSPLCQPPPPPLTLECAVLFDPQPTLAAVPDCTVVRSQEVLTKVGQADAREFKRLADLKEAELEFPTLGGAPIPSAVAAPAAKPVAKKPTAWGSVAVKHGAGAGASAGAGAAAGAAAAAAAGGGGGGAGGGAAAAAAGPVAATPQAVGVAFAKLTINNRILTHLTPSQFKKRINKDVKTLLTTHDTFPLVRTLKASGGSFEQVTFVVFQLLSFGLDADEDRRLFVGTALIELLTERVVGADNVVYAVGDLTSDMPSLIVDVPRAVGYLAGMLHAVVTAKVLPSCYLPAAVAAMMGVEVGPMPEVGEFDGGMEEESWDGYEGMPVGYEED